jgi:hypothetical protein
VRVLEKILAPGVEHTQKAEVSAEMPGVGSDLQQRLGAGTEQEVVDDLFILQRQPGQLVWDGEDNMDVVDRKQFVAACGDPLVASLGLTLRAMPIPAGVEEDGAMAALRTLIPVASERCRAAVLDGSEHP